VDGLFLERLGCGEPGGVGLGLGLEDGGGCCLGLLVEDYVAPGEAAVGVGAADALADVVHVHGEDALVLDAGLL